MRCIQCRKTALEDKDIHDRLASLHPSRQYLQAAVALTGLGRHVLALKLATAEIRWGHQPVEGMVTRIQTLEALGESDRALDEAYEWADREGAPAEVWGVIANLEAGVGNLKGATTALERGLNMHPERFDWWTDYSEIMCHLDDRPNALRAAQKALRSPDKEILDRSLAVLAEVGERYYANGQYAEALGACSLAHDHQERRVELAWLRARIAATNQDLDYLVKWLEATVTLAPDHAEAQAMLEPYKRKKGGWFGSWR